MKLLLIIFLISTSVVHVYVNCQCGISKSVKTYDGTDNTKILGGKKSDPKDWPFVVQTVGTFACTGTIIGNRWILSAAHCYSSSINVFVKGREYESSAVIPHEQYDVRDGININDIMLIKLENPIKFTKDISSVCLVQNISNQNGMAAAVGFGELFVEVKNVQLTKQRTINHDGINFDGSSNLHETPLLIQNMEYCGAPEAFSKDRICAGGEMQGTTRGDSGGPLLVVQNDRWVQYGVTSYGQYMGVENNVNSVSDKGIYAKVTAYCDWIEAKTDGEVKCQ